MKNNKSHTFWNSFARKYDRIIERYASGTYNQIIETIRLELKKQDHVLEIGTGTGLISFAVSSNVKDISAIDFAEEMISVAKEKQVETRVTNISFTVSNAEELPFKEKEFDKVIASNLFHILRDPSRSLKEIRRVLKDDGTIILPTYCHGQNLKTKFLSRLSGLSGFKVAHRWSTAEFKSFIVSEGFKITKQEVIHDKFPMQYVEAKKA